jgi:hypothetical protein
LTIIKNERKRERGKRRRKTEQRCLRISIAIQSDEKIFFFGKEKQ